MRSNTNNDKNQGGWSTSNTFKIVAWFATALVFSLCFLYLYNSARKNPAVYIAKLRNGDYRLMAQGKPYLVKGVCYNPIPVGQNHEYDWWGDPNRPWLADGELMQKMGINTIRLYQAHEHPDEVRRVIRDFYERFGIRTILGAWLGFWEYPCPLYADRAFQERIKKEYLEMVSLYKDEPGVLLWILGNENNYTCIGQINPWPSEADKEPDPAKQRDMRFRIYYSFVNDIARAVHEIDKNHPVALGNGELMGLDIAKDYCRDVDLIACIIYRGKSFGNIFKLLRSTFDKPLLLSEFGADAYDAKLKKEDQNMQAFFLESQWRQIYENIAGVKKGAGNCLGGTMFEWTDEWWKHNESDSSVWGVHDTESNWSNGSYYFDIQAANNKNMNEEWFGLVALSPELENGINKRLPRKSYYVIREFWKDPYGAAQSRKPNIKKK